MRNEGKRENASRLVAVSIVLFLVFAIGWLYVIYYGRWTGNPLNSHFQIMRLLPGMLGFAHVLVSFLAYIRADIFFGSSVRKTFAEGGRISYAYKLLWKGALLLAVQLLLDTFVPFSKFM